MSAVIYYGRRSPALFATHACVAFLGNVRQQAAHAARNANGTISCRQRAHFPARPCPLCHAMLHEIRPLTSPGTLSLLLFSLPRSSVGSSYRIRLMLLGRGHCSFCCRCADSSPCVLFPSPSLSVCELMQAEYYVSHFKFARILLAALHAACVSC